jgi:Uma2 family endonuclease
MARPPSLERDAAIHLTLDVRSLGLTDEQFFRLCEDNRDLRIEMTAQGEMIIMSPAGSETGRKNARITYRLVQWAESDGSGVCFDSSAGFTLPNGAKRSPDASWILKSRWESLSREQRNDFAPICPDFVVELRSPSDVMRELQEKMTDYMENGARLGWLLDPIEKTVHVYRPGQPPELLENPESISGDPVLPGFRFHFSEIL